MSTETADLIIRRAKGLLATIDERVKYHKAKVAQSKRGGPYHGGEPALSDFYSPMVALRDAIEKHEGGGGHVPIPFTRDVVKSPSGNDTVERHESFGLVSFSRSHGGAGRKHLFGSHVETHPTTIRMEVNRAERSFSNDLSYERFHGREHLIEIEMSSAQFADLITLMNYGTGIPCTIKHVGMVAMEDVPDDHKSEQHEILEGFSAKMDDARAAAKPLVAKLAAILAKKSINGKQVRADIAGLFSRLVESQTGSAAFTLGQFNDAANKLATEARREVESYTAALLVNAGLEHLRGSAIGAVMESPALPESAEVDRRGLETPTKVVP